MNVKRKAKPLSRERIDNFVIAQADDDYAWEKPVQVQKGRPLKQIPEFRSREEELDFWATHDSSEYAMEEVEQGPGPRSMKITYRKTRQGKTMKAQRQ